jgi:protease-4
LVDKLGGFWTAADTAKGLAKIDGNERVVFKRFPRHKTFFEAWDETFGGSSATARAVQGWVTLMNSPALRAVIGVTNELPRGGVEMRATNLPH